MRVGFMQPYFFPYIEYFRLIASCDVFVLFDTAQFSRGSWMHRNRLLNREKGWIYFGVPITSQGKRISINNAIPDDAKDWRNDIENKLNVYKNCQQFSKTKLLVDRILSEEYVTLADFNAASLNHVAVEIGIRTEIVRLSDLDLVLPEKCLPGEWALHVCKALNATEYRNPSGGRSIYDAELYRGAGIDLTFHEHINFRYDTAPFEFVPNLSIVDVLMWLDFEQVRQIMRDAAE